MKRPGRLGALMRVRGGRIDNEAWSRGHAGGGSMTRPGRVATPTLHYLARTPKVASKTLDLHHVRGGDCRGG